MLHLIPLGKVEVVQLLPPFIIGFINMVVGLVA